MTSITQRPQACSVTTHCDADKTPPPTPTLIRALAFDHAAKGSAVSGRTNGNGRPSAIDPVYVELGNIEQGTTIEFINLSKKPDAQWNVSSDRLPLEITGRDISNRTVGIYLSPERMKALDVQAGDQLQLRAVDASGNASAAVSIHLEPNGYANIAVREPNADAWVPGIRFPALDGEARKDVTGIAVQDTRAPLLLKERVRVALTDNVVTVNASFGAEPNAQVFVTNQRTGETMSAQVGWDGLVQVGLAGAEGDLLHLATRDEENVHGASMTLVVCTANPAGYYEPEDKAPVGVIPDPA